VEQQPHFIKKRLDQIVAATLLSVVDGAAHAGHFSLSDKEFTFQGLTNGTLSGAN
jgi:hypothetical protein